MFVIARKNRRFKLGYIVLNDVGVQGDRGAPGNQGIGTKGATQRIQRLIEGMARSLGVALGPEKSSQLLPGHSAAASSSEESEEGQVPTSRGGADERGGVFQQRESTKCGKS